MNKITKYIGTILVGSLVGVISGWQGISRDDMLLALLLLFGLEANQRIAAGTVLLSVVFPISIGAVWEYYKRGDVDIVLGLLLTVTYIITATLGAKINFKVSPKTTSLSIIIVQVLVLIYFIYDYMKKK
jgi:uncharacterized membrane protein YfcA